MMSWGSVLKPVGAAIRNAREPRAVLHLGTASWERSERDGIYWATDELRYELVADERARNANFANLNLIQYWIGSRCSFSCIAGRLKHGAVSSRQRNEPARSEQFCYCDRKNSEVAPWRRSSASVDRRDNPDENDSYETLITELAERQARR